MLRQKVNPQNATPTNQRNIQCDLKCIKNWPNFQSKLTNSKLQFKLQSNQKSILEHLAEKHAFAYYCL